ncbi:MAG TPA: succinate dehydrogenase, cytochrome b556 subunit [Gammaproteobacteria bacterium]|mgnify:CR=1 FL=1|jgi:succinate dehydrogenase / fumarate reductase cytochrome b subunit|nr:succinate dehydrogenase, cytochrome b556 subunit [Acidiferrobacteraceae bacterium]MDP6552353.1 succinate dehydrogenase, cytochrome b556 subunit [Arenicellales bacterium]MDP6790360.1 succinate dehydrogenase, cytochrome b556 subunit [Arenicellales bacterium]MDP6918166.1 succinate dehydrogenase, cytochrome b556 subunit [Arenicellales bacterium]HCX87770.1 succinate dehydrogenase, cytochrome b556 subunit [Gammaproteobacteria bacterium]|tara:strand:- start:343 stop:723 length:381 start_codon:yes stop_codon:yes gene_type:complete
MSITRERPLSPHLQIYRPQLTSVLSVFHRLTGIFLSISCVGLSLWLISMALGEEAYAEFMKAVGGWGGWVFVTLLIFCVYYHLFNGIRHLFWDWGLGFSLRSVYASGWAVVALALGFSLLTVTLTF